MPRYPDLRATTHPGEILLEDFLRPSGASQAEFARHIGVDQVVISEIVNGKRGLSVEMCHKFAAGTGCSAEFWWGLQESHEFTAAREKLKATRRIPAANVLPAFTAACGDQDADEGEEAVVIAGCSREWPPPAAAGRVSQSSKTRRPSTDGSPAAALGPHVP